jgi:hypothetical protein
MSRVDLDDDFINVTNILLLTYCIVIYKIFNINLTVIYNGRMLSDEAIAILVANAGSKSEPSTGQRRYLRSNR